MNTNTQELATLTATELVRGYSSGEFTPVDVIERVLARADIAQPKINCFYCILAAEARAAAAASAARWQAGRPCGPLEGVPVTIKENVAVKGVPQPEGTAAHKDAAPAEQDGPITARVREAGGIVWAVTVMPDWGMLSSGVSSLHGITRSPWNLGWTVGGSSAGAGSACAAQLGPLHSGSDIGGSLRLPATWLGLATLKPSFGRVPVEPPYMGRCAGPIARTIDDVALMMSVIAQPDARDYTSLGHQDVEWTALDVPDGYPKGLKIGVLLDAGAGLPVDAEVRNLVDAVAKQFAAAGAEVTYMDPIIDQQLLDQLDLFLRTRSWLDFAALPVELRLQVLPFIQDWVLGGADKTGAEILDAYQAIQTMRKQTIADTLPFDIVLSPVSPVPAFPAEWPMPSNNPDRSMWHIAFAAPFNFSEQPAASVNCGFTSMGKPVGIQIAGHRFDDLGVLAAARWYERTRPVSAVPEWPDIMTL